MHFDGKEKVIYFLFYENSTEKKNSNGSLWSLFWTTTDEADK